MAEFCLECWNRINETKDTEDKYIISDDLDLCEGCGELKHVVVAERGLQFSSAFDKRIFVPIIGLFELLLLPYWVYKYIKRLVMKRKG